MDPVAKEIEPVQCATDKVDRAIDEDEIFQRDWSDDEERRAKRKLDLILMPLLVLGFFCLQLDRGNIANAITDSLMEDVGITQFQFNIGQQLLYAGIVLFEVPSNMILYKVGPGKWLSFQLFLFGLVSTFQAFQTNYAGFLTTRFLLGAMESGYIPGGLWTVSTWYTKKETAKRIMVFSIGSQLGQASAKLIAYGILHMRGVAGYPGWFWLFVLMGIFTVFCGILLGFCLPDSLFRPQSWFLPSYSFFSAREVHILRTRVLIDDPQKNWKKKSIGVATFKRALSYWLLWVHVMISIINCGPSRGFDTYSPTIIKSFGYPGLASNALASVGLFIQIPVAFGFSWVSDRYDMRGETVIASIGLHLSGHILNRIFTELSNRDVRYFGVVWTQIFASISHPLNVAWMALVCRDSEERSLAMAMIAMSANIGAIYGAQIFQSDDAPKYRRAFATNIGLLAAALSIAIGRYCWEKHRVSRKVSVVVDK